VESCLPHVAAKIANSATPFGVYHNTVLGNQSFYNELAKGGGAGIGIFAHTPGTQNYGNVVVNNTLVGNGHPGVSLHNHVAGGKLDDNAVIGNHIVANGADTAEDSVRQTQ
jgi:parallel beta-helix repeat protein